MTMPTELDGSLLRVTWLSVTGMVTSGPEAGLRTMLPVPLRIRLLKRRTRLSAVPKAVSPSGGWL